jgi:hypothetical protein
LSKGRNERVATGVWSAGDDLETLEEVPTFSLQKLEAMAVDALAVQVEMADDSGGATGYARYALAYPVISGKYMQVFIDKKEKDKHLLHDF